MQLLVQGILGTFGDSHDEAQPQAEQIPLVLQLLPPLVR